jgi:hypothetical protein
MNPEVKRRWVEALRSGEYKQGFRKLREGDRFCCLGVLSDLYNSESWKRCSDDFFIFRDSEYGQSQGFKVPHAVKVWAGLDIGDAGILASNNDRGCSFPQIADYIEREL